MHADLGGDDRGEPGRQDSDAGTPEDNGTQAEGSTKLTEELFNLRLYMRYASGAMSLDDSRVEALVSLVNDTFRVRADQDPIYVDMRGHLERIAAPQHQVIFGRRGSGKSCLLIHYHQHAKEKFDNLSLYIQSDEIKMLPYPDLLIRFLLTSFDKLAKGRKGLLSRIRSPSKALAKPIEDLRELLDMPIESMVQEGSGWTDTSGLEASATARPIRVGGQSSVRDEAHRTAQFREKKLDTLERHLQDYKAALIEAVKRSGFDRVTLLVDDFYLIPPGIQPDVVDYLHRLLRDTPVYMKIGTVRHHTTLARRNGAIVGIELSQDVEEINLDQTIEDVDATRDYLATMLDSMGAKVGLSSASSTLLSQDGLLHLTLASGGVPRDFLNIFVNAVEAARARQVTRWLTPSLV